MELPFREFFSFEFVAYNRFTIAKFLAHTSNKLKQIKAFVQCSLNEKLP